MYRQDWKKHTRRRPCDLIILKNTVSQKEAEKAELKRMNFRHTINASRNTANWASSENSLLSIQYRQNLLHGHWPDVLLYCISAQKKNNTTKRLCYHFCSLCKFLRAHGVPRLIHRKRRATSPPGKYKQYPNSIKHEHYFKSWKNTKNIILTLLRNLLASSVSCDGPACWGIYIGSPKGIPSASTNRHITVIPISMVSSEIQPNLRDKHKTKNLKSKKKTDAVI